MHTHTHTHTHYDLRKQFILRVIDNFVHMTYPLQCLMDSRKKEGNKTNFSMNDKVTREVKQLNCRMHSMHHSFANCYKLSLFSCEGNQLTRYHTSAEKLKPHAIYSWSDGDWRLIKLTMPFGRQCVCLDFFGPGVVVRVSSQTVR